MLKRYLSAIIVLMMLIMPLSSCSKKGDYGSVEDTEIQSDVKEADELDSLFEKKDAPFTDYNYKTENYECASFSFEVPDSWIKRIYNQSCIRYDIPDDDTHFPGMTCYVKCNFEYDASPSDLDPFQQYASEFGKNLSPYITGLPYLVLGQDAWIKSFSVADEVEAPDFCSDETAASVKVTHNVHMINKVTGDTIMFEGADFIAAYFRWKDHPVMISMVAPTYQAEDAKSMVEYMMSSAAFIPHKMNASKTFEYQGVTFNVPSDFEATESGGNILISSPQDIKSSSGMSIGLFRVDESSDTMTEDYFQESYATQMADMMADPECAGYYTFYASAKESEKKILDEKKLFLSNIDVVSTEEEYIGAGMTYGDSAVWYMDSMLIEKGNKNYMLSFMYPRNESDVASKIEKAALQSFSVGK